MGVQALQRAAGNRAVAATLQRYATPAKPAPMAPVQDPKFQALTAKLGKAGAGIKQHPPAKAEAKKAADAAVPPAQDKEAQAKAAQADSMSGAKPGGFDKAAFIAQVKQAIAAKSPKNLEEAESFGDSGKAGEVKAEVAGKVADGKDRAAKDIADKTGAAPDQGKAVDKDVKPLPPEKEPPAPAVDAAAAMPGKAPPEQTDLSGGKHATDAAMADADVSEGQLAKSNEPEFTGALADKKKGEQHSAQAPQKLRDSEAEKLAAVKQQASGATKGGLAAMLGVKKGALTKGAAQKNAAKAKDEQERGRITKEIQAIFDKTKTEVSGILDGLDGEVTKRFDKGEKDARDAFTADHKRRMDAYKDERYSGITGAARWLRDKFASLPPEANNVYVEAKKLYEAKMEVCISTVADFIGAELNKAKDKIAEGRTKIKDYVAQQPKNLQKFAGETAGKFNEQFDQLESDVDSKKDSLAEDLATKYDESRKAVDAEIEEMQEANKGLWDKAVGAVAGVIKTIMQLKDMLLGVLARAAGAIGKIIKDPIGFLGNFVNAVKAGITNFAANIVEHLKAGLKGWLLGALSGAGIELPEKFDLPGIVKLVLSILGLTWGNIRARIVKHIPDPIMEKVEKGVEIIQVILKEGLGGLWKWVLEKVGDIKEMVMAQIQDFVVTKIIKAGITWLISLLNPAAAFIKACKMIYDVVMFFVEKGSQIKEFVDSVLDSVESIAGGGVGAVAGLIEKTLARTLPLVLGFLASLLGLGGISEKIKSILETVQKPVMSVVDKVVGAAVKYGKKFLALGKKAFGKVKELGNRAVAKVKSGVRTVGEKLGIIKKPFHAAKESHTISADAGTGQIRIASNEGPIKDRIRERVNLMKSRWEKEGRPPIDVESYVTAVFAQVDRAQAAITANRATASDAAKRELDRLVPLVVDLIVRIGATGTRTERDRPDGLGNVAPHGSQPPRNTGDLPERHLESEHIIPVRMVSTLLEQLGETDIIERGGSEDTRQHTIMIYKGAATSKTRGTEAGDWNLIRQVKSIATSGAPAIEGTNITARRIKSSGRLAETRASFAAKKAQLKETLIAKLPGVFVGRIGVTATKVRSDHDASKQQVRGHAEALPTEDKIRTAAGLQAQDIVEIVSGRFKD